MITPDSGWAPGPPCSINCLPCKSSPKEELQWTECTAPGWWSPPCNVLTWPPWVLHCAVVCRLIVSLKQISRRLICFVLEISPCQSGQSATRVAHASHILSMRAFKNYLQIILFCFFLKTPKIIHYLILIQTRLATTLFVVKTNNSQSELCVPTPSHYSVITSGPDLTRRELSYYQHP